MMTMKKSSAGAFAAAVLSVSSLVACSSGADKPPVCDSLTALKNSVEQLGNTSISQNGLGSISTNLQQIKTDLKDVVDDAKAQYKPQTDAIETALNQVTSSVSAAKQDPSAQTFSGVTIALGNLGTQVKSLANAVKGTC